MQGQPVQGQEQHAAPPLNPPQGENGADGNDRRGARGRRGRRGGPPGEDGQGGQGQGPAGGDGEPGEAPEAEPKPERRGLRVDNLVVQGFCGRCHPRDEKGLMTRISFVRKSPEGWSESIKRMVRLHGLQISPAEAKQVVRYLADHHGLTREEAERSLYESERRVHWSEEKNDEDFKQACGVCHTLGRVLAQARDQEEWQQLRNTHVAMFPLARGQMGGGPPPEDDERFGGPGGGNARRGGTRGGAAAFAPQADNTQRRPQQGDRGDRVLASLAEKQPLFTKEWETWATNRRDVPLAGTWTVTGHEIGRGDLLGTAVITRIDDGEYEVRWQLHTRSGEHIDRTGRGLLYGGYSWRGRSTDPGEGGRTWREVLLLDDRWDTMRGRFFTGDGDEFGVDIEMFRHRGVPRALAVETRWVTIPAQEHSIDVFGEEFAENVTASDFHLGLGVTVVRCERIAANHVRLWLDVAPDATCGPREVAIGNSPASATIELYDAVDYVRIRPTQGLARIGGENFPKQFEHFEAVAVHRGPDGKPYTDDDVDLWSVAANWRMTEAIFRDDDDDLQFVGQLDPVTAVFTPAIDGPNLRRKWNANNTGEVYVECTVELEVPVRIEKKPPEKPAEKPAEKPKTEPRAPGEGHGEDAAPAPAQPTQPAEPAQPTPPAQSAEPPAAQQPQPNQEPKPTQPAAPSTPQDPQPAPAVAEEKPTRGQPQLQKRSFRARASLIVTVPQYMRWTRLEWEDK